MYYYDQLGVGNSERPRRISSATPKRSKRCAAASVSTTSSSTATSGAACSPSITHSGIQANLKRTAALKQSLLSPDKLAQLDDLEAKQDYDNHAYDKIMMEDLYPKMICPHPGPSPSLAPSSV